MICTEICEADAVYAVLYQGRPIKIRRHNPSVRYLGYKYSKSSFPEPGHAIRLARRLNEVHGTEDFTVVQMTTGRTINLT
jgi:transposase